MTGVMEIDGGFRAAANRQARSASGARAVFFFVGVWVGVS